MIARYAERWAIEVSIQDAKHVTGVGEARNHTECAVLRTVPFGFLCQTITIAWYALAGQAERDFERRRRRAPWYRDKRAPRTSTSSPPCGASSSARSIAQVGWQPDPSAIQAAIHHPHPAWHKPRKSRDLAKSKNHP
jgi:hypothetical protein